MWKMGLKSADSNTIEVSDLLKMQKDTLKEITEQLKLIPMTNEVI